MRNFFSPEFELFLRNFPKLFVRFSNLRRFFGATIWVKFGDLLGIIVSPIVMMVVYFGVIFTTKIILRLFKKDILNLKTDKTAKTFWIESSKKFNSMNNQF